MTMLEHVTGGWYNGDTTEMVTQDGKSHETFQLKQYTRYEESY